ncbi:MAG: 50S ribosomal protein P1 [Candidatus Altiarchaeota archaeon]|nr:50S ribosomal protein P1 [Candidatus Altiarchaeota archaeon]
MEYIHAALLLHKAGKDISESSLKKVLTAAGIKVEDAQLKALVSALKDVNIEDAIKTSPVAVAAAPAAAAPAAAKAPKAEAKEEKDEKKDAEDAGAGLAALFG